MTISTQSSQGDHDGASFADRVVNQIDENKFRRNPIPFFVLASMLVHLIGLVFFTVIERSLRDPLRRAQPAVQLVPETAPIDFVVVPPEESTASTTSKLPPQEENLPNQLVEPVAPVPQAIPKSVSVQPAIAEKPVVQPEPIVESLPKETKPENQNSPEILSGSASVIEKIEPPEIAKIPEAPIEVNEPENNSVATRLQPKIEPNNASSTEKPPKTPSTTGAASLLGGNLQKSFADDGGNSFFNPENSLGQQAYNPELDAKQRLDMRNYFSEIKRRVKRNWNPRYSTKEQNTILSFSIQRNGQITALKIRQTSGSQSVDREALKAVENAGPFAPLPANFPLEMLKVEFNFNIYIY